MTVLLTALEMRAAEENAIRSGLASGAKLMTTAGAGVVSALCAKWPCLAKGDRRAIVLCGP